MGQSVSITNANIQAKPKGGKPSENKPFKNLNNKTHSNKDSDSFQTKPVKQESYFENIFATAQDFLGSVDSTLNTVLNYFEFEDSTKELIQSLSHNPQKNKPQETQIKEIKPVKENKNSKVDKGFEMVFAAEAPRITKFFTQITEKSQSISKESKNEISKTLRKIQKNPEKTYELYVELMSREDVKELLSNLNDKELKDFMAFNKANIKSIENYVKKTGNKDKASQYLRRMAAIFDSVIYQNLLDKKNIEIQSNKKIDPLQKKKDIEDATDLNAKSYCADGICEAIDKEHPEFKNQKFDKTWKPKELKEKSKKARNKIDKTIQEKHKLSQEEIRKNRGIVAEKIEKEAKNDLFLGDFLDEENEKIKKVLGKHFKKVGGHIMKIVDGDEDAKKIFYSEIINGKINLSKNFLLKYLTQTLYDAGAINQEEYDQALFTQDYSAVEKHLSKDIIKFSQSYQRSNSNKSHKNSFEYQDTYQESQESSKVNQEERAKLTHLEADTQTSKEKYLLRTDIPEHIRLIAASIPGLVLSNITDMGALLAALKSIGFSAQRLLTITGDMEFVRNEVLSEVSASGFTNNMIDDLVESVIDGKTPHQSAELVFAKLQNKMVKKVYAKNSNLNHEANKFKLQRDLIKEFKNLFISTNI